MTDHSAKTARSAEYGLGASQLLVRRFGPSRIQATLLPAAPDRPPIMLERPIDHTQRTPPVRRTMPAPETENAWTWRFESQEDAIATGIQVWRSHASPGEQLYLADDSGLNVRILASMPTPVADETPADPIPRISPQMVRRFRHPAQRRPPGRPGNTPYDHRRRASLGQGARSAGAAGLGGRMGGAGVTGFRPARLIEARRRRGLTQKQLAELVGRSRDQIGRWESTRRPSMPHANALADLAKALGVTVEWLAGPGRTLGELRRSRGITQVELAERSGIPQSTLSSLERGQIRQPRPEHISEVARVLAVDVGQVAEAHRRSVKKAMR